MILILIGATEKWVCTERKCYVSLAVNTAKLKEPITKPSKITREAKEHRHGKLTPCEIAVKKAIGAMKVNSLIQIESKPKSINSDMVSSLKSQGHLLADLKQAGMKEFVNLRGTINSRKGSCG